MRLLLESEDKDGKPGFRETIERLSAEIPGLTLYIWPRENRENIQGGFARVHAKCAVADRTVAFLTSANLTSAALDRNIEMGVQIKGGDVPESIYQQFIGMIRAKEIFPYAVNRYTPQVKTKTTSLDELKDNLEPGSERLISFKNENFNLEEVRRFRVLSSEDARPKPNTVVLIRHLNQWLIGKYIWSKQQDSKASDCSIWC